MKLRFSIFFYLILPFVAISQNDTLNQRDKNDLKQGYWIYYGKDRPTAGFPSEGKIEEGKYIDNRKEGEWIKYFDDGETVKLRGVYIDNRPRGHYIK
jgi:hypothetical protein